MTQPALRFNARHGFPSGFTLDIEFAADDGVTALFGPSGSGKTTTLNILAGVLAPQRAKIALGDRVLVDTTTHVALPAEQRRIGIVFQNQRLFPHLSVEQNLRYGARRRPARDVDFARVVEILELREFLARTPESLSGGQQQRIALGRAVLRGPELLLLDEPLTGLDSRLKHRISDYLDQLIFEFKIPTLLVSHDQADVRRLAQQIVILDAGRVVAAGPTRPTLDQAILGGQTPAPAPLNLVRIEHLSVVGRHIEGRIGDQCFYLPKSAIVSEQTAFARFSPSDVTLSRSPIAGISIRNQLRGSVAEIVSKNDSAFVRIELGGQSIWAEITPEAIATLELTVGAPAVCLIKATAAEIV